LKAGSSPIDFCRLSQWLDANSYKVREVGSIPTPTTNFMITMDGVRREAERRRMLERRCVKLRDLTKQDFTSYSTLEAATGVDFSKSDIGLSEEFKAINAV
jgi:hypothetical protein